MSYSQPNYQHPQPGYPTNQPGYPPQQPQQQQHYAPPLAQYSNQPVHYGDPSAPPAGYAPPPPHPQLSVDVHQQYGQAVQQGNGLNQPLFSPSQIAMSDASPQHQLGGSSQARMAAASAASGLSELRDRWWLLLFVAHLVMLFVVEGVFGYQMTADWGTANSSLGSDGMTVVGQLSETQEETDRHCLPVTLSASTHAARAAFSYVLLLLAVCC